MSFLPRAHIFVDRALDEKPASPHPLDSPACERRSPVGSVGIVGASGVERSDRVAWGRPRRPLPSEAEGGFPRGEPLDPHQ